MYYNSEDWIRIDLIREGGNPLGAHCAQAWKIVCLEIENVCFDLFFLFLICNIQGVSEVELLPPIMNIFPETLLNILYVPFKSSRMHVIFWATFAR